MKLLYCKLCGDIVAPYRQAYVPRVCVCGEYAVWWNDPEAGILRVHSQSGDRAHATVLGIHNMLLNPDRAPTMVEHGAMVYGVSVEPHSKFQQCGSLIIRIHPGESSDTAWSSKLPEQKT